MKKQSKFDKLPYALKQRVVMAAIAVPTLAQGHGSLRAGQCNARACSGGPNHYQDKLAIAFSKMEVK